MMIYAFNLATWELRSQSKANLLHSLASVHALQPTHTHTPRVCTPLSLPCLCVSFHAAHEQHPAALSLLGAAWVPLQQMLPLAREKGVFEGLPLHRVPKCVCAEVGLDVCGCDLRQDVSVT